MMISLLHQFVIGIKIVSLHAELGCASVETFVAGLYFAVKIRYDIQRQRVVAYMSTNIFRWNGELLCEQSS